MPLKLVRSDSNARLWGACSSRFLDELGDRTGPGTYPSHLWVAHRTQRDLLLEAAEERGHPGWLAPPFSFLSELPRLFGISKRPIGLLTGRLLVSRLAARAGVEHGFVSAADSETPGRGHMVDRALSELLPEGVTPDELQAALDRLPGDAFTRSRNAWLVASYRTYVEHLDASGQFDPRSIHSLVADAIEGGALPRAIGGAERLHVYGVTSLRGRTRLFRALATQRHCEVVVYLPDEGVNGEAAGAGETQGPAADEWEWLADETERLPRRGPGRPPVVQPVPDAVREAEWVAHSIKRLIVDEDVPPHEIAVIARSGRDDTRRVHDALRRVGVPATARLRSRLHEVPALRAVLQLFEAAAREWAWGTLSAVLSNPYLGRAMDLRALQVLSSRSRPRGLEEWEAGLEGLSAEARSESDWILRRAGVGAALLERTASDFAVFARAARGLEDARDETAWIGETRGMLRGERFGLRERANRVVGDRWDIVRGDQRGMLALDSLLREWSALVSDSTRPIGVGEWHARLRRLLESNEIAISSPAHRGVQVLEAHEAGLTPFAHAFVVHANEGVFPPRSGGGLLTEAERETLAADGLPISTRDLSFERERRLWLACTGSREVRISYRTADPSGIPRLASLFVPSHDRSAELARTRRSLPGPDSDPATLLTRAQLLEAETLRFVRVRRSGRPAEFATPDPEAIRTATLRAFAEESRTGGLDEAALRHAVDAMASAALRFDGSTDSLDAAAVFGNQRPLSQRPTPWNGELRDPVLLEYLARHFSEAREWSASQLEQYGKRPFDFLLERVLGLTNVQAAEDDASHLTIGGLLHAVLERFYRGRLGQSSGPFDEDARAALSTAFEAACADFEASERQWIGLPYVWAATKEDLRARLMAFVEWEFSRPRPGTPIAVEYAFGHGADHPAVDLSGHGLRGDELPFLLGGRIDRVDRLDAEGEALRVVDYKSSRSPGLREFEDGAALQAPLYMAAVEAAGLGIATIGTYRTVRRPKEGAERSPAAIDPALSLAREIAARVRAGLFEAVQASSCKATDWQAGRDVTRTTAQLDSGTRFDSLAPMPLPGGPAGAPEE